MKESDDLKASILALVENPAKRERAAGFLDELVPPNKRGQQRERGITRARVSLGMGTPRADIARSLRDCFGVSPRTAYRWLGAALKRRRNCATAADQMAQMDGSLSPIDPPENTRCQHPHS